MIQEMHRHDRHIALVLAACHGSGLAADTAPAQTYPTKPIRIIVGFAARAGRPT